MAKHAGRIEGATSLEWAIYVGQIAICIVSFGFIFPHAGSEPPGQKSNKN
jgi:hypothetical protein